MLQISFSLLLQGVLTPATHSFLLLDLMDPKGRDALQRMYLAKLLIIFCVEVHSQSLHTAVQQVIDLLGVKGEAIGKSVAKLTAFHLANPKATPEDAKAFLLREKSRSSS